MKNLSKAPKLRFPEFSDNWESKTFDDIAEITRLAGYEYSEYWEEDNNQEIIALRGYNIGKGFLDLNNLGYISNKLSLKLGRSRLFKGDIVYPCVGTIGNAVVIEDNDKFHIQQNIAKISPKENVSPYFISQFLMSDRGLNEVYRFNATTSQPNVLVGSLRKFEIQIPNVQEQNKISTFFTLFDQYLFNIKKKKSLLEQYKKGVIQQLFSQELRFKDEEGNDFAGWKDKMLFEVGDIVTGKTPSTSEDDLWDGDIQFVTPTDMNDNKYQLCTQRTIRELAKTKVLPSKSIMFTCIASIGKMSLSTKPCVTNQQINSIIPFPDFDNEFIYYSLLNIVDYIKSTQSTNTLPIINKTAFSKFKISVPSLPEQTKIASFLSTLDDKIAQTALQIEKMQLWKKGLLQQMFV